MIVHVFESGHWLSSSTLKVTTPVSHYTNDHSLSFTMNYAHASNNNLHNAGVSSLGLYFNVKTFFPDINSYPIESKLNLSPLFKSFIS